MEQLTDGPYHDVGPAYLADGRIVFATSRNGIRDEYHGYPCTALWVMNPDGSDMHPIATNIGRDNEPAILHDGRIVFSRLEVFYSRNKTELTVHAARPDGTQDMVLYGPERRAFWQRQYQEGSRAPGEDGNAPLTHRVLRISQPQPMPDGRNVIVATPGGLALIGPRRDTETIVTPDNKLRAFTTPFALPDGRVLCASTLKTHDRAGGRPGAVSARSDDQEVGTALQRPDYGGLRAASDPCSSPATNLADQDSIPRIQWSVCLLIGLRNPGERGLAARSIGAID